MKSNHVFIVAVPVYMHGCRNVMRLRSRRPRREPIIKRLLSLIGTLSGRRERESDSLSGSFAPLNNKEAQPELVPPMSENR